MGDITMPRLSDSMEAGVILQWLVPDGGLIAVGDEIVEIETDKASVVFEAEHAGVLRHGADEGESVAVGARIGTIDEAAGDLGQAAARPAEPAPAPAQPPRTPRPHRSVPTASPTAARLARRIGVPLERIRGTGRDGRVLRADVIVVHEAAPTTALTNRAITRAAPPATPATAGRRVPLTRAQRLVAQRMIATKTTVPDFTVSREMDLQEVHALRRELEARGRRSPSYNDIFLAAVARTLPRHPLLTAYFADGHIVYSDQVNLAVAVSTDAVLHAPVICGADRMSLEEISVASQRLSTLARDGRLAIDDVQGGTFTVSNLGMYGVDRFTAIINAGQSAILAVGRVRETVTSAGGSCRVGWRAHMSLTCDHRIIYGTHAANFLHDLNATLREPGLLQPPA